MPNKKKVTVKLYGRDVEIPQGTMSDEEFSELETRVLEEQQKLKELNKNLPPPSDELPPPSDQAAHELYLKSKNTGGTVKAKDAKKVIDQKTKTPSQVKEENEDIKDLELQRGEAPRGTGARGMVNEMMLGAITPTSSSGQAVDMQGNPLPFNPQRSRMVPDAGVLPPSGGVPDAGTLKPQALPRVPPWLDTRNPGQVFSDFGQTVGAMVGPSNQPPASPALPPKPPVGPPPTQVTPGGVSAGMGVKVSGSTQPGSGIPAYPPKGLEADQRAALEQRAQAQREAAQIQSDASKQIAQVHTDAARQILEQQQELVREQQAGAARQEQVFARIQDAQKVLNDPAQTPDPERYWQNHSKIMFAIGVGLLAANNRDISGVLNSVDNAIRRDIEAQQAAFDSPRKSAREKIKTEQELYGMLRQQGLDAFEAKKAAQTLLSQRAQEQIKALAAASDSELVKANAADMIGQLQQQDQSRALEVAQHAKALGIQEYNAKTNRWEVNVKASAAAKPQTGKLTIKQQNALVDIKDRSKNLLDRIGEARQMIKDKGTFEATGSHREVLNKIFSDVATDTAKLMDPDSVARESEVKLAREALGLEANQLSMTNATAIEILDKYAKDIKRRARTGFQARLSKAGEPLSESDLDEMLGEIGLGGATIQMGAPR